MADVIFGLEPVSTSSGHRSKATLSVRGVTRKQIRHLKKVLQNLLKSDTREAARAERLGYTPYLFQGTVGSPNTTAMNKLMARCDTALAAKTS